MSLRRVRRSDGPKGKGDGLCFLFYNLWEFFSTLIQTLLILEHSIKGRVYVVQTHFLVEFGFPDIFDARK